MLCFKVNFKRHLVLNIMQRIIFPKYSNLIDNKFFGIRFSFKIIPRLIKVIRGQ